MKPVLTAEQMREADRRTIEDLGVPGFTLMETAGRAAAREIVTHFGTPEHLSICCLCGKGNNAGDALVIARLLADAGADVLVQMVLGSDDLSPDARINLSILEKIKAGDSTVFVEIEEGGTFEDRGFDVIVDGLLGTGLSSALRDPIARIVREVNQSVIPVLAIDIPTGLHADTGEIMGDCVIADLTVTMGALKQGLLINEGPGYGGEVVVVEIGIPRFVLDGRDSHKPTNTWIPDREDVADALPRRPRRSHKYSAGMVLAVAGSRGLTGAPALASMAAARVGAGAVVCACPETVQPVLAAKFEEVMTLPLPTSADELIPSESMETLKSRLEQSSAALLGCGLGRGQTTGEFVREFLRSTALPTVIDADGLFALSDTFIEEHASPRWILTPHLGEFRRLVGEDARRLNPVEAARKYATKWGATIILKGMPSVVGCPDGTVFINPTGNQALATAGTGDVLAGMCAGLLAQGVSANEAATSALFVGGLAVERFVDHYSPESMVAGDIIEMLPELLAEFCQ